MANTWIVIADAARARIFDGGPHGRDLDEIEDLSHPESRLHEGDLRTGETGSRQRPEAAARGASGPTTPAHDKHAQGFARDIARYLDHARQQGRFDSLIIAAAPKVLGELRDHLDSSTRATIVTEIDKDWTKQPRDKLKGLLADAS